MSRIALVLAGGDLPPVDLSTILPPPVYTVAADSGISHARALDLPVDVLVGDMDSADEPSMRWAAEQGAVVDVHPATKDQTDLELALGQAVRAAIELNLDGLVVTGLDGGRLDHWLANLLTLGGPVTASVDVTAYVGRGRVSVVRRHRSLTGRPGELISLLAVGGPAHGVTTTGLEYPLRNETLAAGSSRGVSNVFDRTGGAADPDDDGGAGPPVVAEIDVVVGTLLAVQPEHLAAGGPVDGESDGPSPAAAIR